jgi:hypothetical protein
VGKKKNLGRRRGRKKSNRMYKRRVGKQGRRGEEEKRRRGGEEERGMKKKGWGIEKMLKAAILLICTHTFWSFKNPNSLECSSVSIAPSYARTFFVFSRW